MVDRAKIDEWKTADETTRKRIFSTLRVRQSIEALRAQLPIDDERYGKLCNSVHAIPDSVPQAHNPRGQALTFPVFQTAGFLLALNEIALPVGFIALYSSILLDMQHEVRETFRGVARVLIESLGDIVVTVPGRPWYKLD